MSKFIIPKVESSHRDYVGECQNNPVNIDLCTELIKMDKTNGYGKKYPVIYFKGCGVTWYYGESGHKLRDEQYDEILNQNKDDEKTNVPRRD